MARTAKQRGEFLTLRSLWGEPVQVLISSKGMQVWRAFKRQTANPCVKLYGRLAGDQTCRGCFYLVPVATPAGHRIYKCDLRKRTKGAATDHRATWPACGRFLASRW